MWVCGGGRCPIAHCLCPQRDPCVHRVRQGRSGHGEPRKGWASFPSLPLTLPVGGLPEKTLRRLGSPHTVAHRRHRHLSRKPPSVPSDPGLSVMTVGFYRRRSPDSRSRIPEHLELESSGRKPVTKGLSKETPTRPEHTGHMGSHAPAEQDWVLITGWVGVGWRPDLPTPRCHPP